MRLAALSLVVVCALAVPGGASAATGFPDREADPVVLDGSQTPLLLGTAPGRIVAFAFDGGWSQVPVQVDERALVDYRAVRQTTGFAPFSHLAYTDPGTFAGADPDPSLDADDEIAAMAKDSGEHAGGQADPPGVEPGSRSEITVRDPLQPGLTRYLYLFRSDGALDPSAGRSYVHYEFSLDSGDYKTTYDFNGVGDDGSGPPANPEDSTVTTPYYSQHLLSRWVEDALRITAGGAGGADILDGDKVQVGYGCGRSELTFSRGGGGFIVNKSGPVRAIRSYIGANSGTFTQRDHVFYERGDVTSTYSRVHPGITTISQFFDYSPAAAGMTYRNSLNPAGVTIDGNPESVVGGELGWEQVSGTQGSASIVSRADTDLPGFALGSYYLDDSTSPPIQQCGGYADLEAWGSSGPVITSSGANTDPTLGDAFHLTGTRTITYGAPGATVADAELRSRQVDAPLQVTVDDGTNAGNPRLRVFGSKAKRAKVGEPRRIGVRVENRGGAASGPVTVCVKGAPKLVRVGRCRKLDHLQAGDAARVRLKVRLRRAARDEDSVRLALAAKSDGTRTARDHTRLKPA